MGARVGLFVGAECIRAVQVKRAGVAWAGDADVASEAELETAIVSVLERLPRAWWLRPSVVAAVGISRAQFKRIPGLPASVDETLWTAVVRESPSRFFLQDGVPLISSAVLRTDDGLPWAAAYERRVIEAIVAGVNRARMDLRAVVPSVAVAGLGLADTSAVMRDGKALAAVRFEDCRVTEVHRLTSAEGTAEASAPGVVGDLARMGDRAADFLEAFGAATARETPAEVLPGALRPSERDAFGAWRGSGIGAALASTVLAGVLALVAPPLASLAVVSRAGAELEALGPAAAVAADSERMLARFSAALDEVEAFAGSRVSVTHLLADVARALPSGSALLSLRLLPSGGTIVGIGPRGAALPGALERVPGLTQAEIVGPITRETTGVSSLERVMVRFSLHRSWP